MNKIIRLMQNYLIVGLPFVIACMIWETIYPQIQFVTRASIVTSTLWLIFSLNLMLWFLVLIMFLIILVVVPSIREKTLRRLANLKERDEREQYITGKASRTAYIATLSLMLFFLFFSVFTVNISRIPKDTAIDGHHLSVGIGLHFNLLDQSDIKKDANANLLFDSRNISLSNSAIIFILIGWQLLVFNVSARKERLKGMC